MAPRVDVIDFKRSLLRRDAAQVTPEACSSKNLVADSSRDVAQGEPSMIVQLAATPPGVVRDRFITQTQQLKTLVGRKALSVR